MGAPTSSILSEIYLQYIANSEIFNILTIYQIIGYFRYVHDILIIYNDSLTNIHAVLELFKNISQTLHFTIEQEINNSINFLDITIHKHPKISFSIY